MKIEAGYQYRVYVHISEGDCLTTTRAQRHTTNIGLCNSRFQSESNTHKWLSGKCRTTRSADEPVGSAASPYKETVSQKEKIAL